MTRREKKELKRIADHRDVLHRDLTYALQSVRELRQKFEAAQRNAGPAAVAVLKQHWLDRAARVTAHSLESNTPVMMVPPSAEELQQGAAHLVKLLFAEREMGGEQASTAMALAK